MDAINPIVPVSPNIPPITPAPMARRVDRDSSRSGHGQDQRRRRRPQDDGDPSTAGSDQLDYAEDYLDGDDGSGLHIDVTA
jgi:hypothetical protein